MQNDAGFFTCIFVSISRVNTVVFRVLYRHLCIVEKQFSSVFTKIPKVMKNFFTLAIFLFSLIQLQASGFAGGAGTSGDPYQVATARQLDSVRYHLDKYFIQTANINLDVAPYNEVSGWVPIGGNRTDNLTTNNFTGHYNGNGFEIQNLMINYSSVTDKGNIGLFGHIGLAGSGATTIKNVKLVNVNVTGGRGTGALVGRVTGNQNTRIEHCSVTGGVDGFVKGDAAVGGLVGSNNSYRTNAAAAESFRPVIYACWADVNVSLRDDAPIENMIKFGGLAGCNQKGLISNSYSRGSVTVNSEHAKRVGGFAGCVELRGIIINSYSTGAVTAHASATLVGGFLGMVGAGSNEGQAINCFYDETTSGYATSAGGTNLITENMKNSPSYSDWDFSNIWALDGGKNNGYPHLRDNSPALAGKTWNGSLSVQWETAENWTPVGVPVLGDSVVIPGGMTNWPLINSVDVAVCKITFQEGAELTVSEGRSLTIRGEIIYTGANENKPNIKGAGRLVNQGDLVQNIPPMRVNNLTINNYNNARLTGNLIVDGVLTMEAGLLDLNGYEIDLGATGSLIEKDSTNYSSRVFGSSGSVVTQRQFDQVNAANLGLLLTYDGKDPGLTTVRRGHSELSGLNSSKSILRWFDIVPAEKTGLNVSMVFEYTAGDLEFSGAEPTFSLFKRPIGGNHESWVFIDSELNAVNRTLTATGIESFSTWTAANASTPMPIILFSFEGKPVNDVVELSWVTAAEINNDYFTIERSSNGVDFEPIDFVEGSGTISHSKRYTLTDKQPLCGISYYRLKQTDFNGEYEYFKPISIFRDASSVADFRIYPNPSNGQFNIYTGVDRDAQYRIMDMQGRVVAAGTAEGGRVNVINLPQLRQGIYTVVLNSDEVTTKKIQVF
jgi:hypothetical protein